MNENFAVVYAYIQMLRKKYGIDRAREILSMRSCDVPPDVPRLKWPTFSRASVPATPIGGTQALDGIVEKQ